MKKNETSNTHINSRFILLFKFPINFNRFQINTICNKMSKELENLELETAIGFEGLPIRFLIILSK